MIGILEKDGGEAYFELNYNDLGLSQGNYEEIRPHENIHEEVSEAVRTLSGKGNRSRTEIVALNAGIILWAADVSATLPDAVHMAHNQIRSGRALTKLLEWIKHQNRDPRKAAGAIAMISQKAGRVDSGASVRGQGSCAISACSSAHPDFTSNDGGLTAVTVCARERRL